LIALGTSFATAGFAAGVDAAELDAPDELEALDVLELLLPHAAIATAPTSAGIAIDHLVSI
jgi:hypothetical protein